MSNDIKPCRHCSVEVVCLTRGLCAPCWRKPEIRRRYPMLHNRRKASETTPEDITMEALEAMIAERYPTMKGEPAKDGYTTPGPSLPRAILLGRGIDSRRYRTKPRGGNW